ncbi:hypothetical protein K1719_001995 [Acacia pycnantha]|nr:hypothetical protein K1719_001995 [Acacia pycnantha]
MHEVFWPPVGGFGDVVCGLSKALQKKGQLIEIVLPKYICMQYEHIRELRALDLEIESYFDDQLFKNKIWVGTIEGLPIYFIEPHHPNNCEALDFLLRAGKKPDIIHCHDWQTDFLLLLYIGIFMPISD